MKKTEFDSTLDWLLFRLSTIPYRLGNALVLLALYMKFPIKRQMWHAEIRAKFRKV